MPATIRARFSAAIGIGMLILAGCGVPPPPGRVYVVDRPPPGRVEVIPAAPGREYIWVGGYWRRLAPAGIGHQGTTCDVTVVDDG